MLLFNHLFLTYFNELQAQEKKDKKRPSESFSFYFSISFIFCTRKVGIYIKSQMVVYSCILRNHKSFLCKFLIRCIQCCKNIAPHMNFETLIVLVLLENRIICIGNFFSLLPSKYDDVNIIYAIVKVDISVNFQSVLNESSPEPTYTNNHETF